jgi:hypothetical protein
MSGEPREDSDFVKAVKAESKLIAKLRDDVERLTKLGASAAWDARNAEYWQRRARIALDERDALREACKRDLQAWLDAEKFDRQFGLQLPGDSALAVLLGNAEERLARIASEPQGSRPKTRSLMRPFPGDSIPGKPG